MIGYNIIASVCRGKKNPSNIQIQNINQTDVGFNLIINPQSSRYRALRLLKSPSKGASGARYHSIFLSATPFSRNAVRLSLRNLPRRSYETLMDCNP